MDDNHGFLFSFGFFKYVCVSGFFSCFAYFEYDIYSTIQLLRVPGHIFFSSDAFYTQAAAAHCSFFSFRLYVFVVVIFASFLHCLR